MRCYYNETKDIIVRFVHDDEIVIIGDDLAITDDEMLALYEGTQPEGWIVSEV